MAEFINTSIGILEDEDFEVGSGQCSNDKDADNSKNGRVLKYSKANPSKVYMTMVFANWCGPCKMAKPYYKSLSKILDKHHITSVRLTAIDATDDAELANSICVRGYPTFLIWKNGAKKKYTGERNAESFIKALAEHSDEIKQKLGIDHIIVRK